MPWRVPRLHAGPSLRRRMRSLSGSGLRRSSTANNPTRLQIANQNNQLNRPSYDPNDETSLSSLGQEITSDYAHLRPQYSVPEHRIVLAHGLMGFDELHLLPGNLLPGITYWRGIKE